MRPLQILWVKVGGLWPPNTGGRLRSLNMLGDVLAAHLNGCERIESIPYAITKCGTSKFALELAKRLGLDITSRRSR